MIFDEKEQELKKQEQKENKPKFDVSLVGTEEVKQEKPAFDVSLVTPVVSKTARRTVSNPLDWSWSEADLDSLASEFGLQDFSLESYKKLGELVNESSSRIDELKKDPTKNEELAKEIIRNAKLNTLVANRLYDQDKGETFTDIDKRFGREGLGAGLESRRQDAAKRWSRVLNYRNLESMRKQLQDDVRREVGELPTREEAAETDATLIRTGISLYDQRRQDYIDNVNAWLKSKGDSNTYESLFGNETFQISRALTVPQNRQIERFGSLPVRLEPNIVSVREAFLRPFELLVSQGLTNESFLRLSSALRTAETYTERRKIQRQMMSKEAPKQLLPVEGREYKDINKETVTQKKWDAALNGDDAALDEIWAAWNRNYGDPDKAKPAYVGYTYANSVLIDITDLEQKGLIGDDFQREISTRHYAAFLSPENAARAARLFKPAKGYYGNSYVNSYQEAMEQSSALVYSGDRVYLQVGSKNPEAWQANITAMQMGGSDEQILSNSRELYSQLTTQNFQQLYHQEISDSYAKDIFSGEYMENPISTGAVLGSRLTNFFGDRQPLEQIEAAWRFGIRRYRDGFYTADELASLRQSLAQYGLDFSQDVWSGLHGTVAKRRDLGATLEIPKDIDLSGAKVNTNNPKVAALVRNLVESKAISEETSNSIERQRTTYAGATDWLAGTRRVIQPSKSYIKVGDTLVETTPTLMSLADFTTTVAPFAAIMGLGTITGGLSAALGLGQFSQIALSTGVITAAQGAQIWRQTRYATNRERVNATAEMVALSLGIAAVRAGVLKKTGNQGMASVYASGSEGVYEVPEFFDTSNPLYYDDVQKLDENGKPVLDSLGNPVLEKELNTGRLVQDKLLALVMAWVDWGSDIPEGLRASRQNVLTSKVGFTDGRTHVMLNYDQANDNWFTTVVAADKVSEASQDIVFQKVESDELTTIQAAMNEKTFMGLLGFNTSQKKVGALGLTDETAVYWNAKLGKFSNLNSLMQDYGVTSDEEAGLMFGSGVKSSPIKVVDGKTSWGIINGHSTNSIISTLDSIGEGVDIKKHAVVSETGEAALEDLVMRGLVTKSESGIYSLTEQGRDKAKQISDQKKEIADTIRKNFIKQQEELSADRSSKSEDWINQKTTKLTELGFSKSDISEMDTNTMSALVDNNISKEEFLNQVAENPELDFRRPAKNKRMVEEFAGRDSKTAKAADVILGRALGTDNRPLFIDASEFANLSDEEKEAVTLGLETNALSMDIFGNITNSPYMMSLLDTAMNFGVNGYESMLTMKWAIASQAGQVDVAEEAAQQLASYRGQDINSVEFQQRLKEDAEELLARADNFQQNRLDMSAPLKSTLNDLLKEKVGATLVDTARSERQDIVPGMGSSLAQRARERKRDVKSLSPRDFDWYSQTPDGDLGDTVSVRGQKKGSRPEVYTRNERGNYVNSLNPSEVLTEEQLRQKIQDEGLKFGSLKPQTTLVSADAPIEEKAEKAASIIAGEDGTRTLELLNLTQEQQNNNESSLRDGVGTFHLTGEMAVEIDVFSQENSWNTDSSSKFISDSNVPGVYFSNRRLFDIILGLSGQGQVNTNGTFGVTIDISDFTFDENIYNSRGEVIGVVKGIKFDNEKELEDSLKARLESLKINLRPEEFAEVKRFMMDTKSHRDSGKNSVALNKVNPSELNSAQAVAGGVIGPFRKFASTVYHEYIHKILLDKVGSVVFTNRKFASRVTDILTNTPHGRRIAYKIALSNSSYSRNFVQALKGEPDQLSHVSVAVHELLAHSSDIVSLSTGLALDEADLDSFVQVVYDLLLAANQLEPGLANSIAKFMDPEITQAIEAYYETNPVADSFGGPESGAGVTKGRSLEENQGATPGDPADLRSTYRTARTDYRTGSPFFSRDIINRDQSTFLNKKQYTDSLKNAAEKSGPVHLTQSIIIDAKDDKFKVNGLFRLPEPWYEFDSADDAILMMNAKTHTIVWDFLNGYSSNSPLGWPGAARSRTTILNTFGGAAINRSSIAQGIAAQMALSKLNNSGNLYDSYAKYYPLLTDLVEKMGKEDFDSILKKTSGKTVDEVMAEMETLDPDPILMMWYSDKMDYASFRETIFHEQTHRLLNEITGEPMIYSALEGIGIELLNDVPEFEEFFYGRLGGSSYSNLTPFNPEGFLHEIMAHGASPGNLSSLGFRMGNPQQIKESKKEFGKLYTVLTEKISELIGTKDAALLTRYMRPDLATFIQKNVEEDGDLQKSFGLARKPVKKSGQFQLFSRDVQRVTAKKGPNPDLLLANGKDLDMLGATREVKFLLQTYTGNGFFGADMALGDPHLAALKSVNDRLIGIENSSAEILSKGPADNVVESDTSTRYYDSPFAGSVSVSKEDGSIVLRAPQGPFYEGLDGMRVSSVEDGLRMLRNAYVNSQFKSKEAELIEARDWLMANPVTITELFSPARDLGAELDPAARAETITRKMIAAKRYLKAMESPKVGRGALFSRDITALDTQVDPSKFGLKVDTFYDGIADTYSHYLAATLGDKFADINPLKAVDLADVLEARMNSARNMPEYKGKDLMSPEVFAQWAKPLIDSGALPDSVVADPVKFMDYTNELKAKGVGTPWHDLSAERFLADTAESLHAMYPNVPELFKVMVADRFSGMTLREVADNFTYDVLRSMNNSLPVPMSPTTMARILNDKMVFVETSRKLASVGRQQEDLSRKNNRPTLYSVDRTPTPDILETIVDPVDGFYDPVAAAVFGFNPKDLTKPGDGKLEKVKKAPGKQWYDIISKIPGIKKANLQWGLGSWLLSPENANKSLTLEEVRDLALKSRVRIVRAINVEQSQDVYIGPLHKDWVPIKFSDKLKQQNPELTDEIEKGDIEIQKVKDELVFTEAKQFDANGDPNPDYEAGIRKYKTYAEMRGKGVELNRRLVDLMAARRRMLSQLSMLNPFDTTRFGGMVSERTQGSLKYGDSEYDRYWTQGPVMARFEMLFETFLGQGVTGRAFDSMMLPPGFEIRKHPSDGTMAVYSPNDVKLSVNALDEWEAITSFFSNNFMRFSGHFTGTYSKNSNIGHMRGSVRLIDGVPTLFLDEFQSDLVSKMSDRGVLTQDEYLRYKELESMLNSFHALKKVSPDETTDIFDSMRKFPGELALFAETFRNGVTSLSVAEYTEAVKDKSEYSKKIAEMLNSNTTLFSRYLPDRVNNGWINLSGLAALDAAGLSAMDEYTAFFPRVMEGKTADGKVRKPAVPDSPINDNWVELMIRASVKAAVEKNLSTIVWTSGAAQTERYTSGMRAIIDTINYEKIVVADLEAERSQVFKDFIDARAELAESDDDTREEQNLFEKVENLSNKLTQLDAKLSEVTDAVTGKRSDMIIVRTSREGRSVAKEYYPADADIKTPGKRQNHSLKDLFGKEMADKILSEGTGKIEGDEITMGGQFYEQVYDQMAVSAAKKVLGKDTKIVKKYLNPSTGTLSDSPADGLVGVWVADVPKELTTSVKAGMSLYSRDKVPGDRKEVKEQAKGLLENGLFSADIQPIPADLTVLDGFYSNIEAALMGLNVTTLQPVSKKPPTRAIGKDWLNIIGKIEGVKKEEMEWTGLTDFLEDNSTKSLSVNDVLDYIRTNKIQAETKYYVDDKSIMDLDPNVPVDSNTKLRWPGKLAKGVKFGLEMVMTIPNLVRGKTSSISQIFTTADLPTGYKIMPMGGSFFNVAGPSGRLLGRYLAANEDEVADRFLNEHMSVLNPKYYNTIHWDDANVVMWVRSTVRDIDGERVLFMEETQSDIHQKGRAKGYFDVRVLNSKKQALDGLLSRFNKLVESGLFAMPKQYPGMIVTGESMGNIIAFTKDFSQWVAETRENVKNMNGPDATPEWEYEIGPAIDFGAVNTYGVPVETGFLNTPEAAAEFIRKMEELGDVVDSIILLGKEISTLEGADASLIPAAPFAENWVEVAVKRALHEAARQGATKFMWTTGANQVERNSSELRAVMDSLDYELTGGQSNPATVASVAALSASKAKLEAALQPDQEKYDAKRKEYELLKVKVIMILNPEEKAQTQMAADRLLQELEGMKDSMAFYKNQIAQLEASIKRLNSSMAGDRTVTLTGTKEGVVTFSQTLNVDKPTEVQTTQGVQKVTLDEVLGGDMAKNIRQSQAPKGNFSGEQLTIGGAFYELIYDKKVTKAVDKILKKYGVKATRQTVDMNANFSRSYEIGENGLSYSELEQVLRDFRGMDVRAELKLLDGSSIMTISTENWISHVKEAARLDAQGILPERDRMLSLTIEFEEATQDVWSVEIPEDARVSAERGFSLYSRDTSNAAIAQAEELRRTGKIKSASVVDVSMIDPADLTANDVLKIIEEGNYLLMEGNFGSSFRNLDDFKRVAARFGLKVVEVDGFWEGKKSKAVFVYGPKANTVKNLGIYFGKRFGEDAIVYGSNGTHSLIWPKAKTDGHYVQDMPGRKLIRHNTYPETDYGTIIPLPDGTFLEFALTGEAGEKKPLVLEDSNYSSFYFANKLVSDFYGQDITEIDDLIDGYLKIKDFRATGERDPQGRLIPEKNPITAIVDGRPEIIGHGITREEDGVLKDYVRPVEFLPPLKPNGPERPNTEWFGTDYRLKGHGGEGGMLTVSIGKNTYRVGDRALELKPAMEAMPLTESDLGKAMELAMTKIEEGPDKGKFSYRRKVYASGAEAMAAGHKPTEANIERQWKKVNAHKVIQRPVKAVMFTDKKGVPSMFLRGLHQSMFDILNPAVVRNRREKPENMNSPEGKAWADHSAQLVVNYFRELVHLTQLDASNMPPSFVASFFGDSFTKGIRILQEIYPEFDSKTGKRTIAMMVGAFSIHDRISATANWVAKTVGEMSSEYDDDGNLIPESKKKTGIHGPRIALINAAIQDGLVPLDTFNRRHPEFQDGMKVIEIPVETRKDGTIKTRKFFKSKLLQAMQNEAGQIDGFLAYLNHVLPKTEYLGAQYLFGIKGGAMVAGGMDGIMQAHADDLHVLRHIATILGLNVKFSKNENGQTIMTTFDDMAIPKWMKDMLVQVYDTVQATTGVSPLVLNQVLIYGPAIKANQRGFAAAKRNDLEQMFEFIFKNLDPKVAEDINKDLAQTLSDGKKESLAGELAANSARDMENQSLERHKSNPLSSRDRDALEAQQEILAQTDEALTNMDPDAWIAVAERLVTHNKLADSEKQAIKLLAEKGNKDDLQKYVLSLSSQSVFELFVNVGRVSLLLGLRNIQKNLGGNTLRQFMDELSRVPASILDFAFISLNRAIGGKNTDRSVTSIITDPAATLAAYKYALGKGLVEGGKEFIEILRGDNVDIVFEHPSLFREKTTGVKLLKPLEIFEKYGWRFQGAMDRPFNKVAYYRTLHELQTMRMMEEHKNGNEISFDDAEEFLTVGDYELAEMYALQATYQKKNPIADKYYQIVDGLPPTWRAIVSNIFKFVKTPLNVVDYVLDYTGIWQIAKLAHREYGTADWVSWKSSVKRVLDNPQDRKVLSMAVSQGAIGTVMTVIGYAMAKAGLLMPWFDREEKKEGEQMEAKGTSWGEAIIGGRSVDISWLSPNSFYLMVGATMFSVDDTFQRRMEDLTDKLNRAKESGDPEAIERAEQELDKHRNSTPKQEMFSRIFKNFALQTPFLRQLDEIKTVYDQNKLPGGLVEKWFSPAVYVPAIVKEIARTKDDYERVVGDAGLEERFTETIQANIPSLPGVRRAGKALEDTGIPGVRNIGKLMQGREALPAKVDMFGRPIRTGSGLEATGAVAVNQDFLTKEMDRLNVSISKPTGATTKEVNRLREQKGKLFTPYLQSVVGSEGYRNSDDKTKKRILEQTIRFVGESDNLRKLDTNEQNHNLSIISDREYYRSQLRSNPGQFAKDVVITDKETVSAFVSAGLPTSVTFKDVLEDIKKTQNFDQWVNSKFNYEFTVNDRQPLADAQRNYAEFQKDPQAYIISLWARDKRAQESRDRNQDLRQKLFDEGKTKEEVEKELRKQSNRRGVETRRKLGRVKQITVTK